MGIHHGRVDFDARHRGRRLYSAGRLRDEPTRRKRPGTRRVAHGIIDRGLFSAMVLVILAPFLAEVALSFGPPEYFSLGMFGLGIVSSLSSDNPLKGWLVAFLGLAIVTVGIDPISGVIRFTGGRFELFEGVPFMTALIGLFAVAEVFNMIDQSSLRHEVRRRLGSAFLSLRDLRHIMPATLRGSVIGAVLGVIPGIGPSVAAWVAYDTERRWSKHPETFGTGEIKGRRRA